MYVLLGKYVCTAEFINLVRALHNNIQATHVAQGDSISKELLSLMSQARLRAHSHTSMLKVAFEGVGDGIFIQTRIDTDLFNVALFRAKARTTYILVREMMFAVVAHSADSIQSLVDRFTRAAAQFFLKSTIRKLSAYTSQCKI